MQRRSKADLNAAQAFREDNHAAFGAEATPKHSTPGD